MKLKTYSHLAPLRRLPSDYEIGSTEMLWHPGQPFEVKTQVGAWYERHVLGSPLHCRSWAKFADPARTTYAAYVTRKKAAEDFVDGVLRSIETSGYDARLGKEWVAVLAKLLGPALFPCHGLHMAAAYLGQQAPTSRIVICAAFQAADEMRRVQRLAYRIRLLAAVHPGFADDARGLWQQDPAWQPLRALVERLLVTYDWGEAFVALNLILKPAFDHLLLHKLPAAAAAAGDPLLGEFLFSLAEDAAWQRTWSKALVECAVSDTPANEEVISGWTELWGARAAAALKPLEATLIP